MSHDASSFGDWDNDKEPGRNDSGSLWLFWLVLLVVSCVICLFSENVSAGAIIPAVLSMLPSVRAARWIRKNDPHLHRAKACSRFMLATGCWSALCTGFVTLAVLLAVMIVLGEPPTESQGMNTILVIACAATATCLVGCWATWTAWTGCVRVWAHPKLMKMADYDFANLRDLVPPPATCNRAIYVTAMSLTVPTMAIGTGWMIYAATAAPPNQVDVVAMVGGLLLLLGCPLVSVVVLIVFSNRLFADSPADCWSSVSTGRENN